MNVAVSSNGTNLNSQVDPRFGRCQYFIIVDTETMDFKSYPNEFADYSNGAGIQSAQFIVSEGANALITGSCGPKAMQVFTAAGVNVHVGYSGTVGEAVETFKREGLTSAAASGTPENYDTDTENAAPASGSGMGRGMGMGGGAGMGGRSGMGRGMGMGGGAGTGQGTGMGRNVTPDKKSLVDQSGPADHLTGKETLQALKSQAQTLKNKLAEITGRITKIEKD